MDFGPRGICVWLLLENLDQHWHWTRLTWPLSSMWMESGYAECPDCGTCVHCEFRSLALEVRGVEVLSPKLWRNQEETYNIWTCVVLRQHESSCVRVVWHDTQHFVTCHYLSHTFTCVLFCNGKFACVKNSFIRANTRPTCVKFDCFIEPVSFILIFRKRCV